MNLGTRCMKLEGWPMFVQYKSGGQGNLSSGTLKVNLPATTNIDEVIAWW